MIPDLKGLERLLKLCRKQGVTEIVCEGLSLKLGDQPAALAARRAGRRAAAETAESPSEGVYVPGVGMIPPGMTPEEFMFMSSPQPSEG